MNPLWKLAARVFELLRSHDIPYWQIFLSTAVLYLIGTFSYLGVIRTVERRDSVAADPMVPSTPLSPGTDKPG